MKLGALHYLICDGCIEVFHWLAKLPMRHYRPGGVPGTVTTTTFLLTENI